MAAILSSHCRTPLTRHGEFMFSSQTGSSHRRNKSNIRCQKIELHERECTSLNVQRQCWMNRRNALAQILLTSISFPLVISEALAEADEENNFRVYLDEANKFKISVPKDWLTGDGGPDRYKSITAFYPEEQTDSNVSVLITGIGPDFTKLESFGNVDAFAENLVNGLDRSWQRPPGLAAKLINAKKANGLYYVEYTLQNPGESCRHIFSAIGMASNGWYNRLYTVTGQFVEEEADKYRSQIEKAVASFRLS